MSRALASRTVVSACSARFPDPAQGKTSGTEKHDQSVDTMFTSGSKGKQHILFVCLFQDNALAGNIP